MTKVHTPVISDDDFDLVPNADAVSDVSDEREVKHRQVSSSQDGSARGTLAGPHKVPQMPHARGHDDCVTSVTQKLSDHTIEDPCRNPGSAKESGNLVDEGLKYGRSVYNSFRGKTAVIAVMGYVHLSTSLRTLFVEKPHVKS